MKGKTIFFCAGGIAFLGFICFEDRIRNAEVIFITSSFCFILLCWLIFEKPLQGLMTRSNRDAERDAESEKMIDILIHCLLKHSDKDSEKNEKKDT